jgi:hypothetical protein
MLAYKGYEIWIRIRRYMLVIIFVTNKRKVYVKNKTLVEILKSYVRLIFKAYFYNIDIKKLLEFPGASTIFVSRVFFQLISQ